MNAAYVTGIGTTAVTAFLSATNSLGLSGYDSNSAVEIIVTNFSAANILLVKVDGFHDDASNAPQGYGALPATNGWFAVAPGVSVPFRVCDVERASKIERMQFKALSGTVDAGWGISKRK